MVSLTSLLRVGQIQYGRDLREKTHFAQVMNSILYIAARLAVSVP